MITRCVCLMISFTALASAIPANAAVTTVDLAYTLAYQQNGPSAFTRIGGFFNARVFAQNAGDIAAVSLITPLSTEVLTASSIATGVVYNFGSPYLPDEASLDAAFPAGNYSFVIQPSSSMPSTTLTLTRSLNLPFALGAPTVANFSALSLIDANQNFTLQLASAFTPSALASEAFTFASIIDRSTNLPVFNASFSSPSTSNFNITAGTLRAGGSYRLDLIFSNRLASLDQTNVSKNQLFDQRTFLDFSVPASAVPEPASWGLLVAGFAMIGGMMRAKTTGRRLTAMA